MNMVDFMIKLNMHFTDEEKEGCLPMIDKIVSIAKYARRMGPLFLEKETENEENIFLKTAAMIAADGISSEEMEERLQMLILAEQHLSAELLSKLIITQGMLMILRGEHPRIIEDALACMLGEEYLARIIAARKAQTERMKPVTQFLKSVKENELWRSFRDRYYYVHSICGCKSAKSMFKNLRLAADYSTAWGFDFIFYNMRFMDGVEEIVKQADYADLVAIFKSRSSDNNTYSLILRALSESRQLQLIEDMENSDEVLPADIEAAQQRIIELVETLDENYEIAFARR